MALSSTTDSALIYGFGNGSDGQLGYGGEDNVSIPKPIPALQKISIQKIACGTKHCLAISDMGEIWSWGSNDFGQLGHERRRLVPQQIDALETFVIADIAAGEDFSLALTDQGKVFSWGGNDRGQLGLGDREAKSKPRPIKGITSAIVKVTCGAKFGLALSDVGEVYCWGENFSGQLGNGNFVSLEVPQMNEWLKKRAVPVVDLACGGGHTLALTATGSVYCWGENKFGQLGLGDTKSRTRPEMMKTLKRKGIVRIAAGANHTIAITNTGTIFSCGAGGYGQLGQGGASNEADIRAIPELNGIQFAGCGRLHSVVLQRTETKDKLLVCGSAGSGQLGLSDGHDKHSAFVANSFLPTENKHIRDIRCGGDFSFITLSERFPERDFPKRKRSPLFMTTDIFTELFNQSEAAAIVNVEKVFSSCSCLNTSFLKYPQSFQVSQEYSGIDYSDLTRFYENIVATTGSLITACGRGMVTLSKSIKTLKPSPQDPLDSLRFYIIVLVNPLLQQESLNRIVVENITTSIVGLRSLCEEVLLSWLSKVPPHLFSTILKNLQVYLSSCVNIKISNAVESGVTSAIIVLNTLYRANEAANLVSFTRFYNKDLCDMLMRGENLMIEYRKWKSISINSAVFTFCRYPFLFNPEVKAGLLKIDSSIKMNQKIQSAIIEGLFRGIVEPYLVLEVRRDHVLTDAINCIAACITNNRMNLQKPIKVIFVGEEAVDEGGVKKEFFQLVVRDLFDPKYGMFEVHKGENGKEVLWFTKGRGESLKRSRDGDKLRSSIDDSSWWERRDEYALVGSILGLAIFNDVNLDLRLPVVCYKKLMKQKITLQDLKFVDSELYSNLEKLLDSSFDVSDLGLTFQLTFDYFGDTRAHNLLPDGDNIPVTNQNKHSYIELYAKYILEDSIKNQFDYFSKGFFAVVEEIETLSMFKAEELERVICGNPELNIAELEQSTKYVGYMPTHPLIRSFWELVTSLSVEDQRRFLFFVSGSDRVPIAGLKALNFTIQRSGPDSDRLPAAHTCFNILDLPEYSSPEKLKEKLLIAISHVEGFGLK